MKKSQIAAMHTPEARAKRMRTFKRTMRAKKKAKKQQAAGINPNSLPVIIDGHVLKSGEIPLDLIPDRPQPKEKGPWKQGKSLTEDQARLVLAAETVKLISTILGKKP